MKTVVSSLILTIGLLFSYSVDARPKSLSNYGPQVRVAVAQFGATDRFAAEYGGWNIGGGLSAQLVTAMIESNQVVVVERAILSKVLMEQELGQAKLSSSMTQVQAGQLLGVDYLIVGQVTEFEARQVQAGAAFGILKGIGPKVSSDVSAAHVAIDLRIVDTRTGEILHSHRAQGKAWGKSFGVKLKNGLIDFGGEMFHKTPLGKATRRAISKALDFVLHAVEKQIKEFKWLARVIDQDDRHIYIDAGKLSDVAVGDYLEVIGIEKVLTDPETNEILGLVETQVAMAQVVESELKYAKAKIFGDIMPSAGSLIRFADGTKASRSSGVQKAGYNIME